MPTDSHPVGYRLHPGALRRTARGPQQSLRTNLFTVLRSGGPSDRLLMPSVATSISTRLPIENQIAKRMGMPFLRSSRAIAPNPTPRSAHQILRGVNSNSPANKGVLD